MNKLETQKLLNKIITFRQSFLIRNNTVKEWLNVLEPYDYEDVDNKLDEYFRDNSGFGQHPDPYCLTKNLTKILDKKDGRNIMIICPLCGEKVLQRDFDESYGKCSSIDYFCRMAWQYFNKVLNKKELKNMSDEQFEKEYWNFCEELYERIPTGVEKRLLELSILSHKGLAIKFKNEDLEKCINTLHISI